MFSAVIKARLNLCQTDCDILTDAIIKTHTGRLLYKYLSLYCKGSKRFTQGLRVRGRWRSNINCNILTPTLMTVSVVSFLFY